MKIKEVAVATTVIDFHVHLGGEGDWKPWLIEWIRGSAGEDNWHFIMESMSSPDNMDRMLEWSGIDLAVALAELSPITTGTVSNEFVADFCRRSKRLIPFANINPYLSTYPARELERYIKDMGFRGLKLYPTYQLFYPNDRMVYPIYATAEELGIPVMIHTGSSIFKGSRLKYGDPVHLDDVAVDFPDLKILQVHSGRPIWYDTAFFLARLHPNVYLEIAGLPPQNLLTYFPELERIPDKIVFGSDWPVANPKRNVELVRQLPIAEETKAKILGKNAARLLGLQLGE